MIETIISLDLETTGLDISKDRIVEIACVKFDAGGVQEEKHTRINPGIPIPAAASEIHGIYDKDVVDKPTFKQISKSLLTFISDAAVLTYNGNSFDIPLLYAEFVRSGIEWDYSRCAFIDACNIFKRKHPRDLTVAYRHYCESELEGSHSALVDAKATLKVFSEQLRQYWPDVQETPEIALYSNYDKHIVDMGGWFDENMMLAKGKSKGTQDKGFLQWMLKLPDLLPDARKIAEKILSE